MPKPQTQRLTVTTALELLAWPAFATISKAELAVYLKLLSLAAERRTRSLSVKNRDLLVDTRTAVTALRGLEEGALIRITYNPKNRKQRTIEVV